MIRKRIAFTVQGPPIPPQLAAYLLHRLGAGYPGWKLEGVILAEPGLARVQLTRLGDLLEVPVPLPPPPRSGS